jgi:aspartyl-tRNA(Asn)/glutamyl-tRNA(Gln) amidotransferase subunit A
MIKDFSSLSIREAHDALVRKDFSVAELVDSCVKEVEKRDSEIHAFLEVFDDIKTQTDIAQKKIDDGSATFITGIPGAIKDNILLNGKRSSAGSQILKDFVAPYSATATQKLFDSSPVFIGRTNMDEFAMGSSTENSSYGISRNPHDITRVPGGSSGGSAAAVAMNGAFYALGSDTGGSVRQPASFCGVVGLKPTYGAISRHGLIALGSSLDQIGPLTRTVDDARIVFSEMKGTDQMDSTSFYPEEKPENTKSNLTFGVPRDLLELDGMNEEVKKNFEAVERHLSSEGHKIVDIELPNVSYALAVYYIIMPAEASSNLARFDGVKYGSKVSGKNLLEDYLFTRKEGFGKEVRRRIMLGTYVLSSGYHDAYYKKALEVKSLITQDFDKALSGVDVILTPTSPTPAFKIGEKSSGPLAMYLADVFTVPANITGHPAISVPSGEIKNGGANLPIGVQFTAKKYDEATLFQAGTLIEKFYGRR